MSLRSVLYSPRAHLCLSLSVLSLSVLSIQLTCLHFLFSLPLFSCLRRAENTRPFHLHTAGAGDTVGALRRCCTNTSRLDDKRKLHRNMSDLHLSHLVVLSGSLSRHLIYSFIHSLCGAHVGIADF